MSSKLCMQKKENLSKPILLSASEALWRIFNFLIHNRPAAVTSLPVHLPDQQSVYYSNKKAERKVESTCNRTMLTEFFELCNKDDYDQQLLKK